MKANQLFNKILDKWPVKVCCLILAICVYLFHQASLTEKRSFVIPLQIVEEGAVMHTGDYVSNVTVTIRANTEQISSVHTNELQAYINLNNIAKNGEYSVPVMVNVSDEIKAFDPFEIKVKPEYVKIKVESKDLKYITLEPSIVGEPAHGYEITSVKVNPAQLEVTGPESIIENTQRIYTDKIDVTDLTQKETFNVNYKTINKLLSVAEEGPFEVTVTVEPGRMERTIDDIEVTILSLNEKFYLKDDVEPVSVTLEGTIPVLENYEPTRRFVSLDLHSVTEPGEYDLPLVYNVPSYLNLVEAEQQNVHIEVLEAEDEPAELQNNMEAAE